MKKINQDKFSTDRFVNNILLIVLLILLVYILFITGVVKVKFNSNTNNKIDQDSYEEKEVLDVNDKVVDVLYKSVELGRSYNALRHYYFYSYDKLVVKDMDDAFLRELVLSKLKLLDVNSIDASILEKQYKNIVGNNIDYKNRTFQTQCATFKYNSDLNNYTIIKNNTCDISNPDNYFYFDKIDSAYKYGDRIEIISSVGAIFEENELVSEGVYQVTGRVIVKKDIDSKDEIGVFSNLNEAYDKIDYNMLAKYKYTFKLDNKDYYFYSVEIIK